MFPFDQIAFFWIGNDNKIPIFLVKSINLVYQKRVKVFHLTDFKTRKIEGTTKTFRFNLPKDMMLARLQAYRDFPYNKNLTFFCDADSLFVQKLDLFDLKGDIYLIKRAKNFIMNHLSHGYYPEFEQKYVMELMPYLFGGMAFRNGKNFFNELLNICLGLPERFHRWYGDQYSLLINLKKNNYKFNLLPIDLYLKIVRETITSKNFEIMSVNNVKMITFKGPDSKIFIEESFSHLQDFYKNKS